MTTQKHEFDKLCLRCEVKDLTVGLRVSGKPKPVSATKGAPIRDEVIGIVVRGLNKTVKFTQDVIAGDIEGAAEKASRRVAAT